MKDTPQLNPPPAIESAYATLKAENARLSEALEAVQLYNQNLLMRDNLTTQLAARAHSCKVFPHRPCLRCIVEEALAK